jgi:hypothetical protein
MRDKTFNWVNSNYICQAMVAALNNVTPSDLAYLFATGKSELEIRNQIALHMHRNSRAHQVVSREWNRHDLAVLEYGSPRIVVEGKSWIHADAADPHKLTRGGKSILRGLERDLEKLAETRAKNTDVSTFITMVLFTIDLEGCSARQLKEAQIKYAGTHLRGIKNHADAEELAGRGRGALSQFLHEYGIVKRHPLNVGQYLGFKVEADFFLLQPISN